MKELYMPCYLCHDVVREGSRRFDALEPPRTSVRASRTPCFFCEDVVREGSVESKFFCTSSGWFKHTKPPLIDLDRSEEANPLFSLSRVANFNHCL